MKTNDFKGKIELTIRTNGDGIGFDFREFFIWKNSNHKYFIKSKSKQYWCIGGIWTTSFHNKNGIPQVRYYDSLKEAVAKANKLFNIEPYNSKEKSESLKKNYNRFDLMDIEE